MRRAGAVLWLALAVVQVIPAITIDSESARFHAEALRNTFPRPEGSRGERQALDYILGVLADLEVEQSVLDFADFDGGHSYSSVLDVFVTGRSAQTMMVLVPLGHPEAATPDEDGSASLAAAIALLQAVARQDHYLSYRFVFLGAEFGVQDRYPLGTRLLLHDYFPETPTAAIYVAANSGSLAVETGGGGTVAPAWLLQAASEAARRTGTSTRIRSGLNQLHRLGLSSPEPALVELLDSGIPAIFVASVTDEFGPSPVAASAESLGTFLAEAADILEAGIPTEWDRHYLFLSLGRPTLVVPEYVYLMVLVGAVFGTLLYALIARTQFGRYLRTIGRNFWNLPVLFVLIFAFLSAGTLLLELFLIVRRFPTLWQSSPMAYISFKILVSLLLFFLAAQLLRHLRLSRNGSFYSAAALFVLFVDVILACVINVSLSYYFVWALMGSFVFSIVRRRSLKLVTLIVAPVPIIVAAVQILSVPELRFAEMLLLSTTGNLILSFVTLPFLLMLIRLNFLVRHPVTGRRSFALRLATLGAAVLSVGLLASILLRPAFTQNRPQQFQVTERVDYEAFTRDLEITSPAPLGEFELVYLGETQQISTGTRSWGRSAERIPDVLALRLSGVDFLDRNQAQLVVDSPVTLEEVEIVFTSETPMTIYDVDLPYRLSPDRTYAEVFVGKRPPLPLEINYTTTSATQPRVEVIARTSEHPDPILLRKPLSEVTTTLEIRTVLRP